MRETQARQDALAGRAAAAVRVLARACGAIGLPHLVAEATAAAAALGDDVDSAGGMPGAAATVVGEEEEEDYCIGCGTPPKRRRTLTAPVETVKAEGGCCGEAARGGWGADSAEAECASLGFLSGAAAAAPPSPFSAATAAADAVGLPPTEPDCAGGGRGGHVRGGIAGTFAGSGGGFGRSPPSPAPPPPAPVRGPRDTGRPRPGQIDGRPDRVGRAAPAGRSGRDALPAPGGPGSLSAAATAASPRRSARRGVGPA